MEWMPRGVYSPEFREQAVKLVEVEGLAARRLSMPAASLKNWMTTARTGKLQDVGKEQRAPTDLELELARVRKELAEVKQERDLLKKFAAYFAKESR